MNTQQECPECPDNGKLSWQEPAVIQLCYESEAFGAHCAPAGSGASDACTDGNNAALFCGVGHAG